MTTTARACDIRGGSAAGSLEEKESWGGRGSSMLLGETGSRKNPLQ